MTLFKYQGINKFTLQGLLLKQNWASKPTHFNDPFEFAIRSNYYFDTNNKLKYITENEERIRNIIKAEIAHFGVVSFSTDEDNVLLWSHYADNHKGLCLKFNLPFDIPENLFKVEYANKLPHFDLANNTNYRQALTTKALSWKYENEWRALYPKGNCSYNYIGDLVEVIFGCRTSKEDIESVFRICDSMFDNEISFSKMSIQEDSFFLSQSNIFRKKGDAPPKFWF